MQRSYTSDELSSIPCLRRFFASGFAHNPAKDAPAHAMVCLESQEQRLYVNPETGYLRFGRTVRL